jgi:enoyl-CoA hydratase/carnithine racemase
MVYQTLTFERNEGVGIVSLSGLVGRTKTSCLADELADLCNEISYDEATRVVLLTGTGNNPFCIDRGFMHAMPEGAERGQLLHSSFVDPIANLKQPVIAAINGDATGAGLELAMACDIRIGTEGAHFGLHQIQKGFMPSDGGTQRLPRLVGQGRALEHRVDQQGSRSERTHEDSDDVRARYGLQISCGSELRQRSPVPRDGSDARPGTAYGARPLPAFIYDPGPCRRDHGLQGEKSAKV